MKLRHILAAMMIAVAAGAWSAQADDWPGFRGAHGGLAPDQDLPEDVTKDNVLWKVKLPGVGASSPIVLGDKVLLTAYTGYGGALSKGFGGFGGGPKGDFGGPKGGFGKGPKGDFGKGPKGDFGGGPKGDFGKGGTPDAEQKKLKLLVLCLEGVNGVIIWQKEIEPRLPENNFSGMIREHGYASSTPVTDGERVFVFFGKSGVMAFDLAGTELWRADVGSGIHPMGSAASPVLYKDFVIVNAAIESHALVGLDKRTGKEMWRSEGLGTCWASPVLVDATDGRTEVVLNLPGKIAGYDPETGKELWRCVGIGSPGGMGGTSPTPVTRDGVVYVMGGGGPDPMATLAIKAGGTGDVTKTHVLWRQKVGGSYCSPILVGDQLCWIDGTLQSLELKGGKTAVKDRLYDARGEYVSAVASGTKIFALTRQNGLFVLDGIHKFEKLGHYEFDGDDSLFNASPAISNGRLYLRSNEFLYCVGKRL
jgi:outer membrane protein assembly factor BamB